MQQTPSPSPDVPVQEPVKEMSQQIPEKKESNISKLLIIVLLILLPVVGLLGYQIGTQNKQLIVADDSMMATASPSSTPVIDLATGDSMTACPLDAKICSDGSSVGRTGLNCDFEACPGEEGSGELLTYNNKEYGFSFQYSPKYKIVQDKSGWSNAVAILYDGGQSYNLIVEVSKSAAEYQDLNVTTHSGVGRTEVKNKGNLFVVLRNNNGEAEVDQVISTFKFLE